MYFITFLKSKVPENAVFGIKAFAQAFLEKLAECET